MLFFRNTVGRKIVIAVTGQLMVVFVVFHLLGNYFNPYSINLPDSGVLLWMMRAVMLISFFLHTFFSIQGELENRRAKPEAYAVKKNLRATFAGKTMLWTGLLIAAYIIYHVLQVKFLILEGSFQEGYVVAAVYVAALATLFLHLYHGIAGFFQTMGWNSERALPVIEKIGKGLAVVLLAGYISIIIFNRI
ncbi:MAG: succinate dehydrogenase cytochrome b subunit [Nitrospirae bacterium]|nr:succinate dehydrogenase cytochrome b subunit [Nitrospirota bacterium]